MLFSLFEARDGGVPVSSVLGKTSFLDADSHIILNCYYIILETATAIK